MSKYEVYRYLRNQNRFLKANAALKLIKKEN